MLKSPVKSNVMIISLHQHYQSYVNVANMNAPLCSAEVILYKVFPLHPGPRSAADLIPHSFSILFFFHITFYSIILILVLLFARELEIILIHLCIIHCTFPDFLLLPVTVAESYEVLMEMRKCIPS